MASVVRAVAVAVQAAARAECAERTGRSMVQVTRAFRPRYYFAGAAGRQDQGGRLLWAGIRSAAKECNVVARIGLARVGGKPDQSYGTF